MDYEDYSPKNFKSLMMSKSRKQSIITQITEKSLSRRISILGPTGTGKTTLAQLIAKGINCERFSIEKDICNQCRSCRTCLDPITIDCADHKMKSKMLVQLRFANSVCPTFKKTVIILDEAQMLSKKEQASLLLPVENLRKIQIILCTSRIDEISTPLRARFVPITMIRPSHVRAFHYFQRRMERAGQIISAQELKQIIEQSDRIPREIVRRMLEHNLAT